MKTSLMVSVGVWFFPLVLCAQPPERPRGVITTGAPAGQAAPPAAPIDAATAAIPQALRTRIDGRVHRWRTEEAGKFFQPSVGYVGGTPFLMLITGKSEDPVTERRRASVIVAACDFLLDDEAFANVAICVVAYDPERPADQELRNYAVERSGFHAAAKTVAKTATVREAIHKAEKDDGLAAGICAALGLK